MSTGTTSPPWPLIPIANTPIPKDASADLYSWFSIDMCLVHNIMIRAFNALWINAPLVVAADEAAYVGYGLACLATVHIHHHGEETITFPRLQGKLDMTPNIDQHAAFHEPMDALKDYFTRVSKKKEKYDAVKTRQLLEAFAGPIVQHLTDEIATISPERMSVFTKEELTEANQAFEDHLKKLGGFFLLFPFGLTGHDITQAPHWPPVPGPIKWFSRHIGYFVNRSYWKFAPFDRFGAPQTYNP